MLVFASLAAIAVSGCSHGLPTAPTAANDLSAASAPAVAKPSASSTSVTWSWYSVASKWVNKGEAATVSGSRYKIQFVRGSLGQGATVTIMERDASVTDVMVGPNGTALSKAATLTINYAGSPAEFTPDFLKLFRFNDATGAWVAVAGMNDLAAKTFSAKVSVLGRYALCTVDPTKAGW
jgi:hypothetical protein